jgi:phosphoesterase RecJ-like protein
VSTPTPERHEKGASPAASRELARAAGVIREAASVALACHINPDGDALGSMLALHSILDAGGYRVVSSFSEPFVVAPHYRLLPGLERMVPPHQFPAEPDVMVTFDCGSLARLGDLEPSAKAARELVVLDHHLSNDGYGTINVIDPDAAATGVLVRRLAGLLGLPLTRDAAVCLYAALVCDTGRFQYESTTPAVFDLAGELAGFDVPIADLSRTLFEEHRFAYLRLLGEALGRAELVPEKRLVWTFVTQADLHRHGVTFEEIEGLIDIVRRAREAEVTCVLKEAPDGSLRVSMRSLGEVDVSRIAAEHGGGGHRFAAGFTSDMSVTATIQSIIDAL